jgi:AcrR family transcriptional regulator
MNRTPTATNQPDRSREALHTAPSDEPDPRRLRSQSRLLDATAELLTSGGLDAVTVDAVTRRSGVAKTTFYRNFDDLNGLLAAAFERFLPQIEPPPKSDSLREQLIAVLTRKVAAFDQAPVQWFVLLAWSSFPRTPGPDVASAAMKSAPEGLRARLISHYREPFDSVIGSAEGRARLGELDPTLAVAQLLGPIVFLHLSGQGPVSPAVCEEIVDGFLAAHSRT